MGLRPDESAAFQTLGKQAQTIPVPPQHLNDVASPFAKHERVSRERLLVKHVLYLRTQTVKAATQIRYAHSNPDLGPNWKLDDLRRL